MQAIRTIIDSERLAPIISLPLELRNREVEVIVLPTSRLPEPDDSEDRNKNESREPWFTPEEKEQFRRNRERLEERINRQPPKMSQEEFSRLLLQCPVADEETIQRQDEMAEMRRRWKI